jgi:hypothetical protein
MFEIFTNKVGKSVIAISSQSNEIIALFNQLIIFQNSASYMEDFDFCKFNLVRAIRLFKIITILFTSIIELFIPTRMSKFFLGMKVEIELKTKIRIRNHRLLNRVTKKE